MQQNIYTYVAKRIQQFLLKKTGAGYGRVYIFAIITTG